MTEHEILRKAIRKAADNGWPGLSNANGLSLIYYPVAEDLLNGWEYDEDNHFFSIGAWSDYESINLEAIIYNHNFARALWGDKEVHHYDLVDLRNGGKSETVNKPIWHYHLQRMVVADDPIAYLGEHL
jgi:hypothetical protein